ncbi:uncharacterized protein LOC110060822 isoform X1 [Orbicella faveolata]|uniref:uncharacterized protein LOC110060822 isoform X1 n=1 Tax=Orbicella faveolata TaxID=48498 RepID=UPI0009E45640|nr:uncharacterized protein LOC110060822 isoform X1 [Orbicella faveolata]
MYLHKASLFLCGVTMLLAYSASFKLNSIDSMSSTAPYSDGCQSSNSTISCCQTISVYRFSQTVCVNVSSMDKQNVLPFTLSVKGALYIRDTYSDSKPQPYCFEYDDQAAVHLCAIFYNTTFTETQVSACLKLSIQVQAQIIIPLKCFTLSRPTAITVRGEDLENIVTEIMV